MPQRERLVCSRPRWIGFRESAFSPLCLAPSLWGSCVSLLGIGPISGGYGDFPAGIAACTAGKRADFLQGSRHYLEGMASSPWGVASSCGE